MKYRIMVFLFLTGVLVQGQSIDYNTKKGYAAHGYDVVAYFDGIATKGKDQFTAMFDGVNYKFVSKVNLEKFVVQPNSYVPQYGGYCAYAVAVNSKKVNVDPETFEISGGKLYLFYNKGKNNTLQFWLNQSPNSLISKADINWENIKN